MKKQDDVVRNDVIYKDTTLLEGVVLDTLTVKDIRNNVRHVVCFVIINNTQVAVL